MWRSFLLLALLLTVPAAGCERLRSPATHLERAAADLAAGDAQGAMERVEAHGLLSTPEGRTIGLRALLALDRPLEAVDLLTIAGDEVDEDLRAQVCRAGVISALDARDVPTRTRLLVPCPALEDDEALDADERVLRARWRALDGELPPFAERRWHAALAEDSAELGRALSALYRSIEPGLEAVDQRGVAITMAWRLDPDPERVDEEVRRLRAMAEAAEAEGDLQAAIHWYEGLLLPARMPGLPVDEALRAELVEHTRGIRETIAREGVVGTWERRRRARDEAEGLYDPERERFTFPAEPLEARRERLREWFMDRSDWPRGGVLDRFDLVGRDGYCADPGEPCHIPLAVFVQWVASIEYITQELQEAPDE
ncbi:MAG: hypothetical protein EA398_15965 [Deltaproteobacteria bacterium]|nr:MAG: hypothetical protein EA398_15965 [Deltaproteobacteria bacterium]